MMEIAGRDSHLPILGRSGRRHLPGIGRPLWCAASVLPCSTITDVRFQCSEQIHATGQARRTVLRYRAMFLHVLLEEMLSHPNCRAYLR